MRTYQRETVDFVAVKVTRGSEQVVAGLEFAVIPDKQRPDALSWVPQETRVVDGVTKVGVQISGLAQGVWAVFVRADAGPDAPVVKAGEFYVA